MSKVNTFIVPIIQYDNIGRFIQTLYRHTPDNFNLIVIDQAPFNAVPTVTWQPEQVHLWIKSYRNLGFSKAMNTGIKLAQTEYITLCNDDVEFMNRRWWQGIVDTFNQDHHVIAVNPMSPKEGAWGYGLTVENKETWDPPQEYVRGEDPEAVYPKKKDGTGLFYKETFSEEDYDFLINEHPRYRKDSVVDAIAMWCTVFKKSGLDKIGLLDERFYPGGGEDYDMCARAYSCAWPIAREICDLDYHYRMISSTKSWVWHHWGSSKNKRLKNVEDRLFTSRNSWNNNDELWPNGFDVWGHKNTENGKIPLKRTLEVFTEEL